MFYDSVQCYYNKKSLQKYFGCEGVQIDEVVKVTSIFQQLLTQISFYSIRLIVFRFDKGVNVCLVRFIGAIVRLS